MKSLNRSLALAMLMAAAPTLAQAQAGGAASRAQRATSLLTRSVFAPTPATRSGARSETVAEVVTTSAGDTITRTFSAGVPVAYNSNPTHVSRGEDGGVHAAPGASFEYKRKSANGGVLTFSLEGQVDDYFGRTDADQSVAALSLAYNFSDPEKAIAPTVSYQGVEVCAGQFESCKLTLHDASIGFARAFDLAPAALIVEGFGGRRWSNVAEVEMNRAVFSMVLKGPFYSPKNQSTGVGWAISQIIEFQHYTGGMSSGRDDVNYKATLGVQTPLTRTTALGFAIQLEHNESDVAGQDYHAWDVGPVISLERVF